MAPDARGLLAAATGLAAAMGRLVRDWWRVDRVRISPRAGRLLRLSPPCIVRIEGRIVQLLRRSVVRGPGGARVIYDGADGSQRCRLVVTPIGPTPRAELELERDGVIARLAEDTVEVFG